MVANPLLCGLIYIGSLWNQSWTQRSYKDFINDYDTLLRKIKPATSGERYDTFDSPDCMFIHTYLLSIYLLLSN